LTEIYIVLKITKRIINTLVSNY